MASYLGLPIPSFCQHIPQPPKQLFYWGVKPPTQACVAIVGSRTPSPSGVQKAYELGHALAKAGLVVASGLARGIDAAAHQGALDARGHTLGFLGCGIDLVYPRSSRKLYERLREEGTLISEYPPGMPPQPWCFVARNRLIAAWSKGVIVVEAGEKSGALITADLSTQLGRDVFAVPGDCYRGTCRGSNRLVRDGAHVVLSAADVLATPGWSWSTPSPATAKTQSHRKMPQGLSKVERGVWEAIDQAGVLRLDQLCEALGGRPDRILEAVSELEIGGHLNRGWEGLSLKPSN